MCISNSHVSWFLARIKKSLFSFSTAVQLNSFSNNYGQWTIVGWKWFIGIFFFCFLCRTCYLLNSSLFTKRNLKWSHTWRLKEHWIPHSCMTRNISQTPFCGHTVHVTQHTVHTCIPLSLDNLPVTVSLSTVMCWPGTQYSNTLDMH